MEDFVRWVGVVFLSFIAWAVGTQQHARWLAIPVAIAILLLAIYITPPSSPDPATELEGYEEHYRK